MKKPGPRWKRKSPWDGTRKKPREERGLCIIATGNRFLNHLNPRSQITPITPQAFVLLLSDSDFSIPLMSSRFTVTAGTQHFRFWTNEFFWLKCSKLFKIWWKTLFPLGEKGLPEGQTFPFLNGNDLGDLSLKIYIYLNFSLIMLTCAWDSVLLDLLHFSKLNHSQYSIPELQKCSVNSHFTICLAHLFRKKETLLSTSL